MSTYPAWPLYQMTEATATGGIEVRISTSTPDGLVHTTQLICSDLRQLGDVRTVAHGQLSHYIGAKYPDLRPRQLDPSEVLEVLSLLGTFFPAETVDIVRERLDP